MNENHRLKKAAPNSFRCAGRCVQTYKPNPVTTTRRWWLPSFIYAAYPLRPSEDMGRATPKSQPIWPCSPQGLPFRQLPERNVSSYLTFSPLPQTRQGGYSLRHLLSSGSFPSNAPICIRCGALCCLDFPPRIASKRWDSLRCKCTGRKSRWP